MTNVSNAAMVEVVAEDANNYCRILTALGMEEEGDPVAEVERLVALAATPAGEQAGEVVTERQVACIAACIAHGRYVSGATAGNANFLTVLRNALFEAGIPQLRPVGVPDGWKPAPQRATREMVEAGCELGIATFYEIWEAMLAAAPEVPRG